MVAKTQLEIPIYADTSLTAAQQFGIVFKIDENTAKAFKNYGLDLEKLYGRAQPLMPVPAVFVINANGRIAFQYVNPDYSQRLAPEVLRAVLQSGM